MKMMITKSTRKIRKMLISSMKNIKCFSKLFIFGTLTAACLIILVSCKIIFRCDLENLSYLNNSPGSEFQQRNKLLKETCKKYNSKERKKTPTLLIYIPLNLGYCKVPKIASSYWTRFFSALGDTSKENNPFDQIRFKVHRMRLVNITKSTKINKAIENKLIVTRNPYSRLFSAYVDKIVLSEQWKYYGRLIIKNYRGKASPYSLKCGNDVQFHEFLEFVVDNRSDNYNPHWQPITNKCNPCDVMYNFILKQESLEKDRDNFIRKLGIKRDHILNYNKLSHKNFSIHALRDLTMTSIVHYRNKSPKMCYIEKLLFTKLFLAFQIQGYIHRDTDFNDEDFENATISDPESVISAFIKIYNNKPIESHKEWENQRKMYFVKAYQNIDLGILKKIQNTYFLDFKMFDYNLEPDRTYNL